jgi:hypothetical protein
MHYHTDAENGGGGYNHQCARPLRCTLLIPLKVVTVGLWLCLALMHGATLASAWAATAAPFRPSSSSSSGTVSSLSAKPALLSGETIGRRADPRWSLPLLFGRGGGGGSGRFGGHASLSQTTSDTTTSSTISDGVSVENFALLSSRGRAAIQRMIQYDQNNNGEESSPAAQTHVYGDWPPPGIDDDGKRRLAEQVRAKTQWAGAHPSVMKTLWNHSVGWRRGHARRAHARHESVCKDTRHTLASFSLTHADTGPAYLLSCNFSWPIWTNRIRVV